MFKQYGHVEFIVSNQDPCFTGVVWSSIHKLMGMTLIIPKSDSNINVKGVHHHADIQFEWAMRTMTIVMVI